MTTDDLKAKLDELVKNSDMIVSSPETVERLKKQGLPIKSTFETYEEYLNKLFNKKRTQSSSLVKDLPRLGENIANTTIQALYEEIKESFVLVIPGACITLSTILLELALKYRLYRERVNSDPNSPWEYIEKMDMTATINELHKKKTISKEEKSKLDNFNDEIRNPYIHYNIKRLIKDMLLEELPEVNTVTGELTIHNNVNPQDYPALWFSAKRVLDEKTIISKVKFCIHWANRLLDFPKKQQYG